ncbi:hypothetical protein EU523_00260, partial [Candidatus Heimdallarchaeota archaeon]
MTNNTDLRTLLCPFCNEVITFELSLEMIRKRLSGGLATIQLSSHGNPPHSLLVYIDEEGKIRGVYPKIEEIKQKVNLRFNYITDASCEISPEEGAVLGVEVLPYYVVIDGKERKAYNQDIFFAEVFELLNSDSSIGSDPVPVDAFVNAYHKLNNDKPIIVLTMSQKYSEGLT